jgi:hypothetical protein
MLRCRPLVAVCLCESGVGASALPCGRRVGQVWMWDVAEVCTKLQVHTAPCSVQCNGYNLKPIFYWRCTLLPQVRRPLAMLASQRRAPPLPSSILLALCAATTGEPSAQSLTLHHAPTPPFMPSPPPTALSDISEPDHARVSTTEPRRHLLPRHRAHSIRTGDTHHTPLHLPRHHAPEPRPFLPLSATLCAVAKEEAISGFF